VNAYSTLYLMKNNSIENNTLIDNSKRKQLLQFVEIPQVINLEQVILSCKKSQKQLSD